MKTLTLLIGLFLLSIGSFAQSTFQVKTDSLTIVNAQRLKVLENDVKNIKYCTGEYHKQMVNSYILFGLGTAISAAPLLIDDLKPSTENVILGIGIGLNVIGVINTIDALKWMKYISVGKNGVGVKLKF